MKLSLRLIKFLFRKFFKDLEKESVSQVNVKCQYCCSGCKPESSKIN